MYTILYQYFHKSRYYTVNNLFIYRITTNYVDSFTYNQIGLVSIKANSVREAISKINTLNKLKTGNKLRLVKNTELKKLGLENARETVLLIGK